MRIVALDGYTLNPGDNPWDEIEELGEFTVYEHTPEERVVERAQGAGIVLTNKVPLGASTLALLPGLSFISVTATGYNVVDVEAARRRNIPVSNIPVYGTDSVAQYTFALLLELCHHVARHDEAVRKGKWTESGAFSFWETPLVELAGKTMGIIGFGRIGRRVGELAHAFGMGVIACDPFSVEAPPYEPFAWKELREVFAEADVLSLHCLQTEENAGFVHGELLNLMKPSAFFINAARGGLVDEAALAAALHSGTLAGAAVDVVSTEPIREDNPLLCAPNVIITPHIAWAALEARRRLMKMTAENVRAFLEGKPINLVG